MLKIIFKPDIEYRKRGIILSGLVPNENLTKRMFVDKRFQRKHKLIKAINEIHQKFCKSTVRFGSIKIEGG